MAGAGGIRAGRAFIELFVEDGKINPGLQRALAKMRGFADSMTAIGKQVGAVGLGIVAALGGAAAKAADFGSNVADLSQRVGITAETASQLAYAADQSATSIDTLEIGLRNMQKTVIAAGDGNKQAAAALDAIGLSAEQLAGLSPERRLMAIADAVAAIEDPGVKSSVAMRIFGKAGAELIPLLDEGSAGIQAMMQKAVELNMVMSAESAAAAQSFGDQLGTLQGQFTAIVMKIGTALMPTLSEAAKNFEPMLMHVTDWIAKNGSLVLSLGTVGVALTALGGAFGSLGAIITGVSNTFATMLPLIVAHPYIAISLAIAAVGTAFATMGDQAQGAADEVERLNSLTKDSMSLLSEEDAAFQKEYLTRKEREKNIASQQADDTRAFWEKQNSAALAADPKTWDTVAGFMRNADKADLGKKGGWADVVSGGLGDMLSGVSNAIGGGLSTAVDATAGISAALEAAIAKASQNVGSTTAGTFNGAIAAQSLSVNSPEKEIAQNTKDTADAVTDLTAAIKNFLPSFT